MKCNWAMLRSNILIISLLLLIFAATGCSSENRTEFEEGLRLYKQNQLEDALPYLEQASKQQPDNPEIYAWLAETYRRLNRKEEAVTTAHKALSIDSCQAFAYEVIGAALTPMYGKWDKANADSAWVYMMKAIACAPNDGNAWIWIWPEAIHRGDHKLELEALRKTYESGFYTPALLAYNRWVLQNLPPNAILITNGDMDTYPALALQVNEKFRTDIVIVNRSLLNTDWYARYIRDIQKVPPALTDDELEKLKAHEDENGNIITISDQLISGWLDKSSQGELDRPIAIATTVSDYNFAKGKENHFRLMGAYKQWYPQPPLSPSDTSAIRISLESIKPDDFIGSFVSKADRSSVRLAYSDRIVTNITHLAINYSEMLIDSGRKAEAAKILDWAEKFERQTKPGPICTDQIAEMREKLK